MNFSCIEWRFSIGEKKRFCKWTMSIKCLKQIWIHTSNVLLIKNGKWCVNNLCYSKQRERCTQSIFKLLNSLPFLIFNKCTCTLALLLSFSGLPKSHRSLVFIVRSTLNCKLFWIFSLGLNLKFKSSKYNVHLFHSFAFYHLLMCFI